MASLGIDIGATSTAIAAAEGQSVNIVTNELGNRTTPTMVGYNGSLVMYGEAAQALEVKNVLNTVENIPKLMLETRAVTLQHAESELELTSMELLRQFLDAILEMIKKVKGFHQVQTVFATPVYFGFKPRKLLEDAISINNNRGSIVTDMTAAVAAYGYLRDDLVEEEGQHFVILDIGRNGAQGCVCFCKKGESTILSQFGEANIGSQKHTDLLVQHVLEQLQIESPNAKTLKRIQLACERLKVQLSKSESSNLVIENIGDGDASILFNRKTYEQIIAGPVEQIMNMVSQGIVAANIETKDISKFEVIGGGSRTPCIRETLQSYFGVAVKTSLNGKEAIARGCAMMAAVLSPLMRVREHKIEERLLDNVCISSINKHGVYHTTPVFLRDVDVIASDKEVSLKFRQNPIYFVRQVSLNTNSKAEQDQQVEINISNNEYIGHKLTIKVRVTLSEIVVKSICDPKGEELEYSVLTTPSKLNPDEIDAIIHKLQHIQQISDKSLEKNILVNQLETVLYKTQEMFSNSETVCYMSPDHEKDADVIRAIFDDLDALSTYSLDMLHETITKVNNFIQHIDHTKQLRRKEPELVSSFHDHLASFVAQFESIPNQFDEFKSTEVDNGLDVSTVIAQTIEHFKPSLDLFKSQYEELKKQSECNKIMPLFETINCDPAQIESMITTLQATTSEITTRVLKEKQTLHKLRLEILKTFEKLPESELGGDAPTNHEKSLESENGVVAEENEENVEHSK